MDFIDVFSSSKWNLIENLSNQKLSPSELAKKTHTTVGNIGHQLRLLEAYGLLKKERVPNRDKGKPRTLFSLNNNYAYLISAGSGFAKKRLLKLSRHQSIILKMWFLKDEKYHYPLEKFYWKIEDHFDKIKAISVKETGLSELSIEIVSSSDDDLKNQIPKKLSIKNSNHSQVTLKISVVKKPSSVKDIGHIIYDPENIL